MADRLTRPPYALLFNQVCPLSKTGGVDDVQRHPVDLYVFAQQVAGGTGNRSDYRRFASRQAIEQAGFSDIGTPSDDHGQAIT